jgi:hypothetical protein
MFKRRPVNEASFNIVCATSAAEDVSLLTELVTLVTVPKKNRHVFLTYVHKLILTSLLTHSQYHVEHDLLQHVLLPSHSDLSDHQKKYQHQMISKMAPFSFRLKK